MKIIKDKELLRSIAQQIDLFNTVGGGVSETYAEIKKYKKGAVINIWAAGVSPEAFKVILQNNQLTIISLLHSEENPEMAVPIFNRTYILPLQVELAKIEAVHQDGQLQIRLPYYNGVNEPREIEIKQL
ncbi:Hsp20/alpha crystallin family protein [Pontibacter sp. SGAir0037]|uniref:Hsp20/alpha crystallin family protein n=1 Tax=Pontibacter sp. SGAir0037 TaxID=2571030 RepID=UPI0010CCE72B|nr:Hsp20 family protein [Pontibacter sp. SGAir0037]QCR23925.1 Hsp20/alpha crystallin family protein [Pontibacter sp. SGAir0037]